MKNEKNISKIIMDSLVPKKILENITYDYSS